MEITKFLQTCGNNNIGKSEPLRGNMAGFLSACRNVGAFLCAKNEFLAKINVTF